MKYFLPGLAAVVALAFQASATTFTDIQAPVGAYVASGASYSGTFDIVSPGSLTQDIGGFPSGNGRFVDHGGYVPNTPLSSVAVTFYLTDSSFIPLDLVCVNLENAGGGLGIMWGRRATFSFQGGTGVLDALQQDGKLSYTVSSIVGDFTVKYALLQADTTSTASVPDGGSTLLLLGGAFVVLAIFRRRLGLAV